MRKSNYRTQPKLIGSSSIPKEAPLTSLVAIVLMLLSIALWKIPQWQAQSANPQSPKERIELENTSRDTLLKIIQTFGGLGFIVTAYLAWRNLQVAEDKQITERFSKAVEQLGSDKIEVRLGGIYSLERIAQDSPKDHWVIIEVLTSFIREQSSAQMLETGENQKDEPFPLNQEKSHQLASLPSITTDIQAVLTVIGRRDADKDPNDKVLDLRRTNLRGADLSNANLQRVFLFKANLRDAFLGGANLQGANLLEANLRGVNLIGTNLQGVIQLTEEQLSEALLCKTILPDGAVNNRDCQSLKEKEYC